MGAPGLAATSIAEAAAPQRGLASSLDGVSSPVQASAVIATLARRIAVHTLDHVVERGERSSKAPARQAAKVLDRLRTAAGLKNIATRSPAHEWPDVVEDVPMWDSDRKKLEKHRKDHGIAESEADAVTEPVEATPPPPEPEIKVYITRGCPYARAALDLLRQREYAFSVVDVSDDASTRSWLKIATKRNTTPQVFIHGDSIGGFDELRELDHSGELARRLGVTDEAAAFAAPDSEPLPDTARETAEPSSSEAPHSKRRADGTIGLRILRPERSPFENDVTPVDLESSEGHELDGEALLAKVREVLDQCRPMVQADGGDIMLLDVTASSVSVELTGNCVGCPSAQATLRQGIERRLKAHIPQITELRSPQLNL
ncbi:MAG: hypothetical protein B7733_03450 [Myxococcales bacterium FL481]|nr:MAG: hypothetical protein B7733_03450 [Myxococcales bacterium FL481]